jgi:hypothetical protein|tara:strand:+ start:916 stop:1104 length:189 start_codon:yes stop_codon:yes gene_type:complete
MEIKLLKDYKSPTGRIFKAGQKLDCDRTIYNILLDIEGCEPDRQDKKKSKAKKTIKKDGINK